jgi:hypothetical protein
MLAVDFRLPKPKPFRRELIELIKRKNAREEGGRGPKRERCGKERGGAEFGA